MSQGQRKQQPLGLKDSFRPGGTFKQGDHVKETGFPPVDLGASCKIEMGVKQEVLVNSII